MHVVIDHAMSTFNRLNPRAFSPSLSKDGENGSHKGVYRIIYRKHHFAKKTFRAAGKTLSPVRENNCRSSVSQCCHLLIPVLFCLVGNWPICATIPDFFLLRPWVAVLISDAHASGALAGWCRRLITSSLNLAETAHSSTLIHPAVNPGHFGSLAFLFTFALIALVTGTAASIQNYRGPEPGSPGWLSPFVTGVGGLVVGMLVIAIVVAANPVGAAANASANGAPTVHVAGSRFLTNVVLVQKGSTLQVINDDGIEHILQKRPMDSERRSGHNRLRQEFPLVHSIDLKNGSVEIGPFATAGIFHIYCTLHRGMNLTVVVQ